MQTIRHLIALTFALSFSWLANSAFAQTTEIFVARNPGGPIDSLARVLARRLQEELGGQVEVDNKAGANGSIAASYIRRFPGDSSKLLLSTQLAGTANHDVEELIPIIVVGTSSAWSLPLTLYGPPGLSQVQIGTLRKAVTTAITSASFLATAAQLSVTVASTPAQQSQGQARIPTAAQTTTSSNIAGWNPVSCGPAPIVQELATCVAGQCVVFSYRVAPSNSQLVEYVEGFLQSGQLSGAVTRSDPVAPARWIAHEETQLRHYQVCQAGPASSCVPRARQAEQNIRWLSCLAVSSGTASAPAESREATIAAASGVAAAIQNSRQTAAGSGGVSTQSTAQQNSGASQKPCQCGPDYISCLARNSRTRGGEVSVTQNGTKQCVVFWDKSVDARGNRLSNGNDCWDSRTNACGGITK